MMIHFGRITVCLCILVTFASPNLAHNIQKTEENDVFNPAQDSIRNKKLFSLFSIVTFPNGGCASQDASRNGTCYTSEECLEKSGTVSGNCAAGFGVCCLFIVSSASSSISENCTYIQNPSFPSVYSSETALTYTINKCASTVCAVRLDFETFQTAGPSSTAEVSGGVCTDSFVVSGTSGLSSPVICGSNAGQHIYMEMGNSGSTDTATLAFTFSGTSTVRTWEIKATQIPCGARYRQPEGCLQWHTTLTGRFQTFNFAETTTPQHLASQNYGICIRNEANYCCIQYALCSDSNSYSLDNVNAAAKQDSECAEDFIEIDGVGATCSQDSGQVLKTRLCGGPGLLNVQLDAAQTLTSVCDCSPPFQVSIYTDAAVNTITGATARGVCIEYNQIGCAAN